MHLKEKEKSWHVKKKKKIDTTTYFCLHGDEAKPPVFHHNGVGNAPPAARWQYTWERNSTSARMSEKASSNVHTNLLKYSRNIASVTLNAKPPTKILYCFPLLDFPAT